MRIPGPKGILVALVAAATLVPAAAARSHRQVQLPLVPLRKGAIGKIARPLALARDSGTVSNADAASRSLGSLTAGRLDQLGRVTGYQLDYGTPFGDGARVHQVETGVERYRTRADARQGLVFWRKEAQQIRSLSAAGVSVTLKKVSLAGAGGPHWAYLGTVRVQGLQPIYGLDAQIRVGKYLLDVSVSAGSAAAARRLAPKLAHKLGHRLLLAARGRLHGRAVKLPPALQPGPPATGPRPDALVLTRQDLGSFTTIRSSGYSQPKASIDENAVSVYDLTAEPAGSFIYLQQEILVAASELEAEYYAALVPVGAASQSQGPGTPVDVSAVGDGAQAELVKLSVNGQTIDGAVVVLSRGAYVDWAVVASPFGVSASSVQSLARSMAHRFDAGFTG